MTLSATPFPFSHPPPFPLYCMFSQWIVNVAASHDALNGEEDKQ